MNIQNLFFTILAVSLLPAAFSQPKLLPNTELSIDQLADRPQHIKPGLEIYGVPWTASMDEFKLEFGPPTGILFIDQITTTLIYGKSHALTFENGELREVVIARHLLNYRVANRMMDHPYFDNDGWEIEPGIRTRMTFDSISQKLFGGLQALGEKKPDSTYIFDNASVTFAFGTFYERGAPPEGNKRLLSVVIRSQ